jgi:hypothetical protein
MADLRNARRYLGPSKWEASPLSRVSWHAWPAAILVALIAFVCASMTMDPAGEGFGLMINMMQNFDDVPKVARTVAALAALHVAINLGVLAFDRSKAFPLRLLDAASIVVTLFVIWACFDATALFTPRAS